MSYDLNHIVQMSNNMGYNTLAMCAILAVLSFFNLLTLLFGLIYYLRKVSIIILKNQIIEEDENKSDNKKLEIE